MLHIPSRDVNIITCLDTLTSLLAGFIIFGILGHLAHVIGCEISEVTSSNLALAFLAYPETIAKIDFMPQFFSMVFFFMLFVLGIGTCVGMTSTIMTTIRDKYPEVKCWKIALGISAVGITVGSIYTTPGGQFLMSFVDFYGGSFIALILAIIELVTVGWIYGVDRFCKDIEFMLGRKTGLYWRICWGFITPAMMTFIFIYVLATWQPLTYQNKEYHPNMHGELLQMIVDDCQLVFSSNSFGLGHFCFLPPSAANFRI
jgi:solute carrier family 6 (neurotransmitter transporter, glycine) member 5/9